MVDSKFVMFIGGIFSIFLGITAICNWCADSMGLLHFSQSFQTIHLSSALGFVIAGISMMPVAGRFQKNPAVFAIVLACLGLYEILEYIIHIYSDFQNLAWQSSHDHPAPLQHLNIMSSFCFLMTSANILLMQQKETKDLARAILNWVLLSLSLSSILSYVLGIEHSHLWHLSLGMPLFTSIGFFCIGLACTSSLILSQHDFILGRCLCFSVSLAIFLGFATAAKTLKLQEIQNLQAHLKLDAQLVVDDFNNHFTHGIDALKRMALRISNKDMNKKEWFADAPNYYKDFNYIDWIGLIDKDGAKNWVYPENSKIDAMIKVHTKKLLAYDQQNSIIVKPLTNNKNNSSFILTMIPIDSTSNDLLVTNLNEKALFLSLLPRGLKFLRIKILRGSQQVTSIEPPHNSHLKHGQIKHKDKFHTIIDLNSHHMSWKFVFTPSEDFVDRSLTFFPTLILIFGILFSLLSAFAIYFYQRAKAALIKATENEQRYDIVTHNAGIAVWEWHNKGKDSLFCSPKIFEILGYEQNAAHTDLITFFKLVHKEDLDKTKKAIKAYLERSFPLEIEVRLKTKSGSYRWFLISGKAKLEANDSIRKVGSIEDIHEKHILQESQERITSILNSSPDYIIQMNANHEVTYANRSWVEISRQISNERASLEEIFTPKSYDIFKSDIATSLESQKIWRGELSLQTDKNKEIPVSTVCIMHSPSKYPDLRVVSLLMRDIRKEKETAKKLTQFNQELTNANIRFDLAIQGVEVGIWDWPDVTKNEVFWSDKMIELLGHQKGEIEPSVENFMKLVHPDDDEQSSAIYQSHLQNQKPYNHEYRLLTKSGEYRWFRLTAASHFDNHGNQLRMVGAIEDIEERKAGERKLVEAKYEMENFLYTVSHDLKSPLVTIKGYADRLIDSDFDLSEKVKVFIKRIKANAVLMNKLVNDLLDISQTARVELKVEKINLLEIVNEVLEVNAELILSSKAQVYPPKTIEIFFDQVRLNQVLTNLLTNAIRYRAAHRTPEINISCKEHTDQYIISVKDNGRGIREDNKPKIFGMFEQIDPHEKEGTGVGLTIAKTIIEKHGGSIWLESEVGLGTTFYFSVPKK